MQNKGTELQRSVLMKDEENFFSLSHGRLKLYSILVILIILVGAIGLAVWYHKPRPQQANSAKQHTLQTNLNYAIAHDDNQQAVADASQLISGERSGIYTMSKTTLSTYYLEEGAALMNLKESAKAVRIFQAAAQLGGSNTEASLEGELMAGYDAGERKQLIPVLEQLDTLAKQHPDPFQTPAAQYGQDIQALKNNQPITL